MSFSTCPGCNKPGKYDGQFDAYYCDDCNIWIENGCEDAHCEFCADRPEKPNKENQKT